MDYQQYRKASLMLYIYLFLGFIWMPGILIFAHYFGDAVYSNVYAKTGLVVMLAYAILWVVLWFAFLMSKRGREFQEADARYKKKRKKK
jgi:RsiW-degrading membrane proteinase PrsW (M82 family)